MSLEDDQDTFSNNSYFSLPELNEYDVITNERARVTIENDNSRTITVTFEEESLLEFHESGNVVKRKTDRRVRNTGYSCFQTLIRS